jgi:hypothetical protein
MAPERPRPSPSRKSKIVSIAAVGALLALFAVAVLAPSSTNANRPANALDPEGVVPADAGTGSLSTAVEVDGDALGARAGRNAAAPTSGGTIVVGFRVLDTTTGQAIAARGESLTFALARLDERWGGRPVPVGLRFDEALGAFDPGSKEGSARLVLIELDPTTPRGVPIAFTVEFEHETEQRLPSRNPGQPTLESEARLVPRDDADRLSAEARADRRVQQLINPLDTPRRFRGTGELTLTDEPNQRLEDVLCARIDPLASGVVLAAFQLDQRGARVEVMDVRTLHAGESTLEASLEPFVACASALVRPDGSFTVLAPGRPVKASLRLRVVLADGQVYDQNWNSFAFSRNVVLQIDGALRSAAGKLLFRGSSATGLARVHAERGGALVGTCELDPDGRFTLRGLPYEPFDVVVQSARPSGELARYPLASLTGASNEVHMELGTLELEGLGTILELELVDTDGKPTNARLDWRSRGGAGSAVLRAAPLHSLLMPAALQHDLEVRLMPNGVPVQVTTTRGRARIVLASGR